MDERARRVFVVIAALLVATFAPVASAADWPGWRGPDRDASSPEKGLLQQWGPGGPPLAWKSSGVGSGFAGVAVAGERLYTMGDKDGSQHVFALKREGGAVLWAARVGPPLVDSRGGARATPVVDGERVYAIGTGRRSRVPRGGHGPRRAGARTSSATTAGR